MLYYILKNSYYFAFMFLIASCEKGQKKDGIANINEETGINATPTEINTGLATDAHVVRVKIGNVTANPDGNSWDNAYADLQAAIDAHLNDEEVVLVVAGPAEIKVTTSFSRDYLLNLSKFRGNKLSIYGGYTGNENEFSKISGRGNFPAYPLVLSGEKKAGNY